MNFVLNSHYNYSPKNGIKNIKGYQKLTNTVTVC